jgi:hypothetical protein
MPLSPCLRFPILNRNPDAALTGTHRTDDPLAAQDVGSRVFRMEVVDLARPLAFGARLIGAGP